MFILRLGIDCPRFIIERAGVADGGLLSYGPDFTIEYRRAAGYVDRILNGGNIASLSVQSPTKYELIIDLDDHKALGVVMRQALLSRADEVIE